VKPEVQCLATSSDDLLTWQKHPANPVLSEHPQGLNLETFRDPFVWRDPDNTWYMVLGSGVRGSGGACLLYRSTDLLNWEFLHPLLIGEAEKTGRMWNCPNFFPVEDRHILIISGQPVWKLFYWCGAYQDQQFTPLTSGLADYGGCLYAGLVFNDESNRTLFWGWIWESRSDEEILKAGWAGVMSLPRIPFLTAGGALGFKPAPEVESLRKQHRTIENQPVSDGCARLDEIHGVSLEIKVKFDPGSADQFGLQVLSALDQSEFTRIGYDLERREVFIDRSHANLSPTMAFNWPNPTYHAAPLHLGEGEGLELRIFIDHSIIEVFTPQGPVLSSRVYTIDPASQHAFLFANHGQCRIDTLDAWELE
jgi:beta-fructofuranosidase